MSDRAGARTGPPGMVWLAAWLLAAGMAVAVAASLWDLAVHSGTYPHWDAAAHALDGVQMARAIAAGEWRHFLALVSARDKWAPLFPILEVPVFLARGYTYDVAAAQMPFYFALATLAVFTAGAAIGGWRGLVTGAVASACFASSAYVRNMATTTMLEIPGTLFLMLALAAYIRFRRHGRPGDARLAAIATTLLVFCKWNYGFLWLVPLGLNELGHSLVSPARMRARGLPVGLRALLVWTVFPLALWFANPRHAKAVLRYAEGLPQASRPLIENLIYYPRVFVTAFMAPPWLAAAVLLTAGVAVVLAFRLPAAQRILPVGFAAALAMITLHFYKYSRFLFTIAPFVWLCFGLVLAIAIERLLANRARLGRPARAAFALGSMGVGLIAGLNPAPVRALHRRSMGPPALRRVLDAIGDVHRASRGTALMGFWDKLSNPLVEWDLLLAGTGAAPAPRPMNPAWYGESDPARVLDRLAVDPQVERVMILDLPRDAPAYGPAFARDNPHHARWLAAFAADPRFRLDTQHFFPATGYTLFVYAIRR